MEFNFFRKNKEEEKLNPPETLKSRMEKGLKPIRACLIDNTEEIDRQTQETIDLIEKNGEFVDYDADIDTLKKNNMRNAGEGTYAISECNNKDKFSKRYYNCTGVIIVGEDKGSKKQISLMSHQNPSAFLGWDNENDKKKFIKDMSKLIKEIKNKTKNGTIDAVVFGGEYGDHGYKESIKLLNEIIKKELNFEPTVMTGPNMTSWGVNPTEVYFDTQNRRLYILRPQQKSEINEDYLPSELDKKSENW